MEVLTLVFFLRGLGWCIPGLSGPLIWTTHLSIICGTVQIFFDFFLHLFCSSCTSSVQRAAHRSASSAAQRHAVPCPAVPCRALAVQCGILRRCVVSCRAVACCVLCCTTLTISGMPLQYHHTRSQLSSAWLISLSQLCSGAPCGAVPCRALPCPVVPCRAVRYCAVLCHDVSY